MNGWTCIKLAAAVIVLSAFIRPRPRKDYSALRDLQKIQDEQQAKSETKEW